MPSPYARQRPRTTRALAAGPRDHLLRQPRLADAGIADDRDHPDGTRFADLAERLVDRRQFFVAADDRRVVASHVALEPARRDEPERGDPLALSLELERLHRLHLNRIPHQVICGLAEIDLVFRGCLLQACGDVDSVACRELLVGRGVVVRDDLAGVDAGAVGQDHAVARRKVLVHAAQRGLHSGRGPDRPQRIVLVRQRQPEHRHDRVADVLLDLAAVLRISAAIAAK